MILKEREGQESLPTKDPIDPYAGITNTGLLSSLTKYRDHLPEGKSLYVASVLRALAEVEGLPGFSEDRYSLTGNFKALFTASRIVPMEKGDNKGLILDDTGADVLIVLGYFYRTPAEGGLVTHNFTNVVERGLGAVCANGRLAAPLQRFLECRRS